MANEKIIIVDDEPDILDLCKRILELNGYHVCTAENGSQAIEQARSEQFDLLLTDILMPDMNGLEIAQAIKTFDPSIVCVAMTGFSTMDMVIEALRLGVDEFITKPFEHNELGLVISKAFEKDRLRKEVFRLRSLIPLFALNQTLMATVHVDQVVHSLIDIARTETRAEVAGFYLFEDETLKPYHPYDDTTPIPAEFYDAPFQNLAQQALERGHQLSLHLNNTTDTTPKPLLETPYQATILTPLKSQNARLGVLIVARQDQDFAHSDSNFLEVLCSQASIALENARLFTQTQQAYEQLKKLDHMKSEFINIAAHELRTPLAILLGYTSVLQDDADELQQAYMSHIMRNALRLRALIDDMLNLQYLESGVTYLSNDTVNLDDAIAEILQDNRAIIEPGKKLAITVDIASNLPDMVVDRQKFDLIVVNLIHNALKFTPPDGTVSITAHPSGDMVVLTIHNSAPAIPADELQHVFERFYQVEKSLTRQHGGMGLGLSIVHGMVEVCGGTITVTSTEEEGTVFTVMLPLDNRHLGERVMKV